MSWTFTRRLEEEKEDDDEDNDLASLEALEHEFFIRDESKSLRNDFNFFHHTTDLLNQITMYVYNAEW